MIKLKIKYGNSQTDLRFPCTEKEMNAALERIHAEDVTPLELYVSEVIFPEELGCLQDRFVNLDEVNYLGKRMDSFFGDEEYPETLEKIGQLYTADDCRSKSEFIEKAVQFYIDHLTAEDQRSMLPNAMLSSMKSIVAESDNRICRLLFKMAVELAVTMNVVAASSEIDDVSLERLKGECVKEVKRLNGIFTFRDANDWQKG